MTEQLRRRGALIVAMACGSLLVACGSSSPRPTRPPDTVVLQGNKLVELKAAMSRGDAHLEKALANLTASADKQLSAGPWSVMNKPEASPSGDRHDYYSISIYAWPDPSKPDGLPWVTRDGEKNPDKDTIGDSNAWSHLVDAVRALGLAWFYTGDERYANRAALVLRTWFLDPATRMNPNLLHAQRVPGVPHSNPGGIIDFADLGLVIDAATMLEDSPSWTGAEQAGFRDWLSGYLEWLRSSPEGSTEAAARNNHSGWYQNQVAAIAALLGRTDVLRGALAVGQADIDSQIALDGEQPQELKRATSWDYSVYNLRALGRLAAIGQHIGIDLWAHTGPAGGSLSSATDFLVPAASGESPWTAGRQIKPLDRGAPLAIFHAAALAGDARAGAAIPRLPKGGTASDPWLLSPAP